MVSLSCELRPWPCWAGTLASSGPWPGGWSGQRRPANGEKPTPGHEQPCCSSLRLPQRQCSQETGFQFHLCHFQSICRLEEQLPRSLIPPHGSCFFQMPVAGEPGPGPHTQVNCTGTTAFTEAVRAVRAVRVVRAVRAAGPGGGDRLSQAGAWLLSGQAEGSVFSSEAAS